MHVWYCSQVSAYFNPGILLAEAVRGRVGGTGDFFALLGAELLGYFSGEREEAGCCAVGRREPPGSGCAAAAKRRPVAARCLATLPTCPHRRPPRCP